MRSKTFASIFFIFAGGASMAYDMPYDLQIRESDTGSQKILKKALQRSYVEKKIAEEKKQERREQKENLWSLQGYDPRKLQ